MDNIYDPTDLFLGRYDYDNWFENQKSNDITKGCEEESADTTKDGEKKSADLPPMPPQGDEEGITEGKGINILIPNKQLPWLPILFAPIKAGNNSYKLKNKIRQIYYLLYQQNKISKKLYN